MTYYGDPKHDAIPNPHYAVEGYREFMTPPKLTGAGPDLWDTHIPIPTNETQFKRCPQVELLIAMPVGASKFYPEASSKVVSWGKSARKRGGGRYAIRQRTEDGVHGVRIWRTA